jgi:hypothetical protein
VRIENEPAVSRILPRLILTSSYRDTFYHRWQTPAEKLGALLITNSVDGCGGLGTFGDRKHMTYQIALIKPALHTNHSQDFKRNTVLIQLFHSQNRMAITEILKLLKYWFR